MFRQAGVEILSYPALVDRGDSVAIELCDYAAPARQAHRLGVLRMLRLHSAQTVKYLRKQLLRGNEFNLILAGAGQDRAQLVDDLIDAAYVQALGLDRELPYAQEAFFAVLEQGRGEVVSRASEMESILRNSLQVLSQVRHRLAGLPRGKWGDSVADMEQQLAWALLSRH